MSKSLERVRNKTLFIVEGKDEKEKFFSLLIRCFPELNIDLNNVFIFENNVYNLYRELQEEYGDDWDESDVDVAFLVSKLKGDSEILNKLDFTDIILIFDFEIQDTYFSYDKISRMQSYFVDSTDMGKIYINYPMFESMMHFNGLPSREYENEYVSVETCRDRKYKGMVRNTYLSKLFNILDKDKGILRDRANMVDDEKIRKVLSEVENIKYDRALKECVGDIKAVLDIQCADNSNTVSNQLVRVMEDIAIPADMNFIDYMRYVIAEVSYHNICKINKINEGTYDIEYDKLGEYVYDIDYSGLLNKQYQCSAGENGIIWVVNTSVLLIAEYNVKLIQDGIL